MRYAGLFCTLLGLVLTTFTLGRMVSFAFGGTSQPDAPAGAVLCPALAGLGLGMLLLLGGTLMLWKAKQSESGPSE